MRHLSLAVMTAALALALAAQAAGADCTRSITIVNTSASHSIHVVAAQSRTRANATWTDAGDPRRVRIGAQGCVATPGQNWQGNCGFIASAAPNAAARFTAYDRVLGCGVARRTRIEYACVQTGYSGPIGRNTRTIDLHGGGYADPRDMTLRLGC